MLVGLQDFGLSGVGRVEIFALPIGASTGLAVVVSELSADVYIDSELFFHFPLKRCFGGFSGIYLASRTLPIEAVFDVLEHEDLPFLVPDDREDVAETTLVGVFEPPTLLLIDLARILDQLFLVEMERRAV